MKKSILKLGEKLNKSIQKSINGGQYSYCPPSPTCYGVFDTPLGSNCGTCEQYHALPFECKMRVKVSVYCFDF